MAKKRKAGSDFTASQQPNGRVLFWANTPGASRICDINGFCENNWSVILDGWSQYFSIDGYHTLDVVTWLGQQGLSVLPCDADLEKFRKDGVMAFCEPTERD